MKSMEQELKIFVKQLKKQEKQLRFLLDTKGPEIRTHNMENGAIELTAGANINYFNDRSSRNDRKVLCYI